MSANASPATSPDLFKYSTHRRLAIYSKFGRLLLHLAAVKWTLAIRTQIAYHNYRQLDGRALPENVKNSVFKSKVKGNGKNSSSKVQ